MLHATGTITLNYLAVLSGHITDLARLSVLCGLLTQVAYWTFKIAFTFTSLYVNEQQSVNQSKLAE